MSPVPHCTSIMRAAGAACTRRGAFLFILAGLALAVSLLGFNRVAVADHAFTIDAANWDAGQSRLTANGHTLNRRSFVDLIVRGPDGNSVLTTTVRSRENRRWQYDQRGLNIVPCTIEGTERNNGSAGPIPIANRPAACEQPPGGGDAPIARGDSYTTPRGNTLTVTATRLSGVLYNDFDPEDDVVRVADPGARTTAQGGSATLSANGSFTYTPPGGATGSFQGDDQFTYQATDGTTPSEVATVNVRVLPKQTDFKFMMNYELGMHCTGFEFAYCCVLPVYNSIVSQVVKPESQQGNINNWTAEDLVRLMEGDPNVGRNLDVLGRETVVRDPSLDENDNFNKYVVKYWHDAQSRNEGQGKPQVPGSVPGLPGYLNSSTLISDVEGNTLLSWNTRADAAARNADGSFVLGGAECEDPADLSTCAAVDVVQGDGSFGTTGAVFGVNVDNYQNAIWNHLYIFEVSAAGVEGEVIGRCVNAGTVTATHCTADGGECPTGQTCDLSVEAAKVRLGLDVDYPTNFGPGGHPMGPVSGGTFNDNAFMTFSGDTGTVVHTQMKLVENLPVMLTSPRIWEALGLPLTPFEDTLGFFDNPGLVDEDSIRPYVQMMAQLHEANCAADGTCTAGAAVLDSTGNPVQGFGDAPIDIPNCERCHSAFDTQNSPNVTGTMDAGLVQLEIDYWKAYYDIDTVAGDADWYARLKGAAISILSKHDTDHNTQFLANYPAVGEIAPDGTRVDIIDPGLGISPADYLGGLSEPFPGAPAFCIDPVTKTPTADSCSSHAQCEAAVGAGSVCDLPQNTRIGHESVLCHKCHADNVIAVVKSTTCGPNGTSEPGDAPGSCNGQLIPSLSESLHHNHRSVSEGGPITFNDGLGRDGSCQGCHPAHRSDGVMDNYPIDLDGNNAQFSPVFDPTKDNRLSPGGCFVGRDVHSNPFKDVDAGTPSYLTVLGEYLRDNVAFDSGDPESRGVWCTNCHSQAGQQIWKTENCPDLINGDCIVNPRAAPTMQALADMIVTREADPAVRLATLESWADPKDPDIDPNLPLSGLGTRTQDDTYAIWRPDAGLCNYVAQWIEGGFTLDEISPEYDGAVALVEVAVPFLGGAAATCQTGGALSDAPGGTPIALCNGEPGIPTGGFFICGSYDADGDFTAALTAAPGESPFCTTQDCKVAADATLTVNGHVTAQIPFGTSDITTATDGRDHWLSPGEPHCADCHQAPFTEQSGNINAFPPFNYPRKASLMRYSRGHQDVTCQGCHESIHGLYPVTPTIDNTSYAQAAALNHDGSHGPLKCGACHRVAGNGTPAWHDDNNDGDFQFGNFDNAVTWAHTFTDEADPRDDVCLNCHEDESDEVSDNEEEWLEHSMEGRVTRKIMDKVERLVNNGFVFGGAPGEDPLNTVCEGCHNDRSDQLARRGCTTEWKEHLTEGRVAQSVWEDVSGTVIPGEPAANGTICGW